MEIIDEINNVAIRASIFDDAEQIIELLNYLDYETNFMLFEPGERTSQKDIKIKIKTLLKNPSDKVIVAANAENQLIGLIMGFGGKVNRQKHTIHIVIGVMQKFCSQGIGKQLMQLLEIWAINNKVHRLQLTVMVHNKIAINFYKKCGFLIEGIKRDSIRINGKYIDEFYMSKLI